MKHHYSPDEVNTILERALAGKPLPGDMTRDQLVQLAAEIGVTPEELDAAESQVRSQAEPDMDALHAEYQGYLKHSTWLGIALLIGTSMLFAIANFHLSGLAILVLLFLSFGVAFGLRTHAPFRERRFRRWLRRREHRDRFGQALSDRNSRRLR